MKYVAKLACSVCIATCMVFCLILIICSTTTFVASAHAANETASGSIKSSPSSGPVGTIIAVNGSGWPDPNEEQVTLGYMIAANCLAVSDSQVGTFHSGSFSGWLSLPHGTPLGTYSICAMFGSTTANAHDFTLLSETAPQISISPNALVVGKQATITGSNYLPSGTAVHLFWETTNGSVLLALDPVVSNGNGNISKAFLIPTTTTVSSGSYKIVASVGNQQPDLTSSASFTFNAPTPTPTPLPSPTPQPTFNPTPTHHQSPTKTITAVATPTLKPKVGSATPVVSQNTTTGHTPTSVISDNSTILHQPSRIVLIGSVIGFLALLATILIIMVIIRRKKAHSLRLMNTFAPAQTSPMSRQNNQPGSSATGNMLYPLHNGSMAFTHIPAPSTTPSPQQLQMSPYAHLLQQSDEGHSDPANDPMKMASNDPGIESLKRRVQMGLFVTSGQRRDD